MTGDLAYLSATEALSRFRERSLSPVELTQALIARAEATEPQINAITYRTFDEALAKAKEAEARYAGRGPDPRPLEGICVAVKDAGDVAGQPTSGGSLLTSDAPKPTTSPINQRILEAGAIVHARSATPEFSCATFTHSRRWGVTRNPWNPAFTPGGSSGGAGAMLAAGSTTLASGSDIGGSIRIPASCCGVVGYKPPKGRTPVDVPFNLDPYCHTGPMARTVADTLLFQNLLSGPHPEDPTTLPPHQITAETGRLKGLRVAYSPDLGFFEVAREVRTATEDALCTFEELGATVEEVQLPWGRDVIEAALTHLKAVFGASLAPGNPADWDRMTSYARTFAEEGLAIDSARHYAALTKAGCMGKDFARLMQAHDVLICPTTAIPAVPATYDHSEDSLRINGVEVEPMLGWTLTVPFNMISTAPVLSVPTARAANGVPLGLQIVGRPFDDTTVFRAALAYEAARGPWYDTEANRPVVGHAGG